MIKQYFYCLTAVAVFFASCSTGINRSEAPGILRVTLQSDPADTTITIMGNEYRVDSASVFNVNIFEARAYIGENYTFLVPRISDYRDDGKVYNILEMENDSYKQFTIYESYVPVDDYTRLQFGLTASAMKIGDYQIPVQLPPDKELLIDLVSNFHVAENETTEVNIYLAPFRSVRRYRDIYLFDRIVDIVSITRY